MTILQHYPLDPTLVERFGALAAALLGVEWVRIYHDQALSKERGGGRTPWHQDEFSWPLDTEKTVTMWMPLHDVTPETGLMAFADGSHRLGDLRGRHISDRSDAEFAALVAEQEICTCRRLRRSLRATRRFTPLDAAPRGRERDRHDARGVHDHLLRRRRAPARAPQRLRALRRDGLTAWCRGRRARRQPDQSGRGGVSARTDRGSE